MTKFEEFREKYIPYLGTLIILPFWKFNTIRLVDVVEKDFRGSPEWYYEVEDDEGEVTFVCTGMVNALFLKKEFSEEPYNMFLACWNRNKTNKAI